MAAGRPLYRVTDTTQIGQLGNRVDALERRRPVSGFYEIKVFADDELVETGNGAFIFAIPYDLNKAKLSSVNAFVTTAGTGATTIMIRNVGVTDMLTTPITIDSGTLDAEDSATAAEIDLSYFFYGFPDTTSTVFYRDQIAIDVDTVGTGAMGLGVMLGFN